MKSPMSVAAVVFALACVPLSGLAADSKREEERAEQEKQRAEEAREKAQEARERAREQEKARRERDRDRHEEERERAAERSKELAQKIRHKVDTKTWLHNPDERAYRRGLEYLDARRWEKAIEAFDEVLAPPPPPAPPKPPASGVDWKKQPPGAPGWKGPKELLGPDSPPRRPDAALYWKAYALQKMGRRSDAQAAIDTLRRDHPKSGWLMQAKMLEAEVKQASGQAPSPESETDDDLKLIALNALAKTDPERAVPLLEKILIVPGPPGLQERALFVLAQSGSPRAREITIRIVRGSSNPDLQMKAVRNLAAIGDDESKEALAEAYRHSADVELKKVILHHLTAMGAHEHVVSLVQSENDPELLTAAARSLMAGGRKGGLYVDGGKTQPGVSDDRLVSLYTDKADRSVRREIVDVLADRGNARALVAVARKETEPELRRHIVERLSQMKSKEATDYLVEILGQ